MAVVVKETKKRFSGGGGGCNFSWEEGVGAGDITDKKLVYFQVVRRILEEF